MTDRPRIFTLDPHHHLAQGLVFAGLGAHSGTTLYHDSSVHSDDAITDGTWGSVLGRRRVDLSSQAIDLASNGQGRFDVQAYTIAGWYNVNSNQEILWSYDYTSHANPYYAQHVRVDSGEVRFAWNILSGATWESAVTTTAPVTQGQWHHVACTFRSGRQEIWVDGVLEATNNSTHTVSYYDQEVWVGQSNFKSNSDMSAVDVCFWQRVLPGAAITALADPSNVMLSGLIQPTTRKWWPVSSGAFINIPAIINHRRLIGAA